MDDPARLPTATYRLQLQREFGFRDAASVVPYLAELGVSHVYCSPVLQAVPGSAHGYDVVDHRRLSADLGGEQGWAQLIAACRSHGLGLVVDIVPNHMAIPTPERLNAAMWDVLAHGPASAYAHWFDIDWEEGGGKLLMPVLGRPVADCLRDGEITIDAAAGVVRYFDHELPLAPGPEVDDPGKLGAQHYRLAFWRVANEELNYRRFFDVTTLIGVRVELPDVFDATHDVILRLVRDGEVHGLRVDHPDGLADPGGYLEQLRAASGGAWTVVEKILEDREELPRDWACDGTTGYDALAAVTGVLVDRRGGQPMSDTYARFTGRTAAYDQVVRDSKRFVIEHSFAAEVERLLRDLEPLRRQDVQAADFTSRALREAIVELLVSFEVYRAYADDAVSREHIDHAVETATASLPARQGELAWLRRVLRRDIAASAAEPFVTRFEQTTGPVTAKGVEDTAYYRYHRLVALNEVGGNPGEFGRAVPDWHDYCARVARDWPATMTTLSTHDTKRSEDVRARLLVLAEIPDEWESAVTRWRDRAGTLDPNTDYLFWQTMVGAHSPDGGPLPADRMLAYLEKATKEAKERTSWTDPDPAFELALRRHVKSVYADDELLQDIAQWVRTHLVEAGRSNSLAQKLLQLTMPGIPDVYQGQELTELALVDPDNRRPVDYSIRRRAVDVDDGVDPKLVVTRAALRLRRERPGSFAAGYSPVAASGATADHVLAFRRSDDVITVVTRLPMGLARAGGWADTRIDVPDGDWTDVVSGRAVTGGDVAALLDRLPVALLARAGR